LLNLASQPGTTEGDLADKQIQQYQVTTVGRVSNVEVRVESSLKAFYEIGKRYPTELRPGRIEISGAASRAYINGALIKLLLGAGAETPTPAGTFPQPTFNIVIPLQNPAFSSKSTITLFGVKFQNWNYSIPEDDFVLENVTFKALSLSVEDAEGK
jgi:hypothetical protein